MKRLALAALLSLAACTPPAAPPEESWRGMIYDDGVVATDFALVDQHGETFRMADHRGQVVLLFFGYAHCPDVCPVTLSTWAKVQVALEDRRDELEFVFVTVDPHRDTPDKLKHHLEIFSRDFVGLTGTQEELEPIYEDYGIFQELVPLSTSGTAYVVDHSTRILVVDRSGRLRLRFAFDTEPADIIHDVERILDEEVVAPDVAVVEPWARPTRARDAENAPLPELPGVLYARLVNRGDAEDRLLAVHTDVAAAVELHETRLSDDRMRMLPVPDGIAIPAEGEVALRPGGYHVMLLGLRRHLAPGERFEARFEFERAGIRSVGVAVRDP